MKNGYARVSPGGKSESVDAQARQLTKAGCSKVFRDVHVSGAKTDRAQLRRVIEALEPADVLMVTRLDRLARSTRDLLNTLAAITAKKALAYVQLRRHHRASRAASPKMASAGQHLVRRLHRTAGQIQLTGEAPHRRYAIPWGQLTCGDRIPEAPIQLEIDWCPPISERLQITQIHVDVPFEETFIAPVN